jgi:hypothetical protein
LTVSLCCLSSSCVLYVQCWQCLYVVCLRPVSCMSNVDSVSMLFVFVLCLVCPMLTVSLCWLSSSCVLYVQCWQCLYVDHSWLPLRVSLTFIYNIHGILPVLAYRYNCWLIDWYFTSNAQYYGNIGHDKSITTPRITAVLCTFPI